MSRIKPENTTPEEEQMWAELFDTPSYDELMAFVSKIAGFETWNEQARAKAESEADGDPDLAGDLYEEMEDAPSYDFAFLAREERDALVMEARGIARIEPEPDPDAASSGDTPEPG